jgi:putative glutamine amidotransferase
MCSSFHHQAIDRLARGLVETGRADDGTIEAVEVEGDQWIVGVQWHPEDTAADDPHQQRLFDELVRRSGRK